MPFAIVMVTVRLAGFCQTPQAFFFDASANTLMPVRIRLAMHGRRHARIFHLVAINQRAARNSKPIETLGIYDPALHPGQNHKTVEWSVERIKYWLKSGAIPSKSAVKILELVRYFVDPLACV